MIAFSSSSSSYIWQTTQCRLLKTNLAMINLSNFGHSWIRLINSFQRMFVPQQQLSIDEAMISFKGRLSFLQFLPKKPKKWGMKAWALTDSKMGYVWNWKLYTGKEEEVATEPLGERVLLDYSTALKIKDIMCTVTITTLVLAFASVSSPWILVVAELFGWTDETSWKLSRKRLQKRVRLSLIRMIRSLD